MSSRMKIDLSGWGVPVPEGQYSIEVVQATLCQSAAGDEYLDRELKIEGGEHRLEPLWIWMVSSLGEDMFDLLAKTIHAVSVPTDGGDVEIEADVAEMFVFSDSEEGQAFAVVDYGEEQDEARGGVRWLETD